RCHAQASGPLFRCAEDGQAVRSGHRHAGLNLGDFPYSVVRLETDHSAVPICQHVSRRAQRRSRRAAGPCTAVHLVLDRSEHADTLRQIERKPNAALTANTVSTAISYGALRPSAAITRCPHMGLGLARMPLVDKYARSNTRAEKRSWSAKTRNTGHISRWPRQSGRAW